MGRVLPALVGCALLVACTRGDAEPVYALVLGGQSGVAGHGGDSAAGHSAAGSGDAGVHDAGHEPMKSACEITAPPWSSDNVDDETAFLVELNEAIKYGEHCGDHAFMRDVFSARSDLTCLSRYTAFSQASGAPWGHLPGQGPSHDPFQPQTQNAMDTDQIIAMGPTSTSALAQVFDDGGDCSKLMMSKYTAVGVGHYGDYWVITLGTDGP